MKSKKKKRVDMKRLVILCSLVLLGTMVQGELLETVFESERLIGQHDAAEHAHQMTLEKLDAILEDESLSDEMKESRIRALLSTVQPQSVAVDNANSSMLDNYRGALCLLGILSEFKSDVEAARWYRKAAKLGDSYAQNRLGWMYANGRGVEQSDTEAVRWYYKAAMWGNASAQYKMGTYYANGIGVEKSPEKAAMWYRKAAEQGYRHDGIGRYQQSNRD